MGTLLAAFFDNEKLRRGGRYAAVFDCWRSVVGERLAAHSRIIDLEKGILIVEAEHPGWIQLLQVRQTQTLDALKERFPDLDIRGIAFKLAGTEYRRMPPAAESGSEDTQEPTAPEDAELPGGSEAVASAGEHDSAFTAAIESLRKAINSNIKK